VIDENPAQLKGRNRVKVSSVLPVDRLRAAHPQVRLVEQRRGLQGVGPPLPPHLCRRDVVQFGVNQIHELAARLWIS
jgi:hypothetical protein